MKRSINILFILVILFNVKISGQEQPDRLDIAEKHFFKLEYAYAAPLYEELALKRTVKPAILFRLAYCYDEMQQYQSALKWYRAYAQKYPEKNHGVLLRIADILKITQDYTTAKNAYALYLKHVPGDSVKIKNRISGCDSAIQWLANKPSVVIQNELRLNSAFSDWGATYYGKQVVYTSEDRKEEVLDKKSKEQRKKYGWMGNPYLRLYVTKEDWPETIDPKSSINENFGEPINGHHYHVGAVDFSKSLDTVYFTITHEKREVETLQFQKRGKFEKFNLEIFYSTKDAAGKWKKPIAFEYNNPSRYSVGHPALSKDGSTLYFTSDMPGGIGKTDIWFCKKGPDGLWQTPQNCGPAINTAEEEAFATIAADGTLYFSSKGLTGMGGFDIFTASGSGNNWLLPTNLKPPFNSGEDDFYFSIATDGTGYFSSNRPGGKGSDDIYSFASFKNPLPAPQKPSVTAFKLLIVKNIIRNALDSTVISNSRTTLTNRERKADWVKHSDTVGQSEFILEKDYSYIVKAESPGFIGDSTRFQTFNTGADTIINYLYLKPTTKEVLVKKANPPAETPFKVGDRFVLEDLYYDYDKYNIRADAALILDKLVATLKKYPALVIELSSHTDSRGSDQYNEALSQHRAESAVAYLVNKGIAASRLQAKGYGETRLLNRCKNGVSCSAAEHQLNRRTEVRVLQIR